MKKRAKTLRSKIHVIERTGARQPAVEAPEVLLMMETIARWISYDHRHKTYLSKQLLWIAARLVGARSVDTTHWELDSTFPDRMFWMGLDLKYFNVIDPIKFGWFWYQLGETGKFSIKWQKELINSGKEPPELLPLIITKPYWTPKIKTQKQHAQAVKEHQDNYMAEEIINHFFV